MTKPNVLAIEVASAVVVVMPDVVGEAVCAMCPSAPNAYAFVVAVRYCVELVSYTRGSPRKRCVTDRVSEGR